MADPTALVAPRFTRAVHLQRDFRDLRHRLDGYQITPLVRQLAARVIAGLAPESGERAFSVIGPFGAGKSAFGVFLGHYLQRTPASRRQLLAWRGVPEAAAQLDPESPSLMVVLVPAGNVSLRTAVLSAMRTTLAGHLEFRGEATQELLRDLLAAVPDPDPDPQAVVELLRRLVHLAPTRSVFKGVLLLIDELGQYLDYAARHDDERDLVLLQAMAEFAARSGPNPCVVVTILHQAFERYTVSAGANRRQEWAKVQGRFADLAFQEPACQMIRMVAQALRPTQRDPYRVARAAWAAQVAPLAEQLGLRPTEIGADEWRQIVGDSYPIHPTVLVALPGLFRQLAQNERSLFAFLHSEEPWALPDTLGDKAPPGARPIYRLTQLCAYMEATLGHSLFGQVRGQRWAELAEARVRLAAGDPLAFQTLTVVGTIDALERSSGLRASADQVAFALADANTADAAAVRDTLAALKTRGVLAYDQHHDRYSISQTGDQRADDGRDDLLPQGREALHAALPRAE